MQLRPLQWSAFPISVRHRHLDHEADSAVVLGLPRSNQRRDIASAESTALPVIRRRLVADAAVVVSSP